MVSHAYQPHHAGVSARQIGFFLTFAVAVIISIALFNGGRNTQAQVETSVQTQLDLASQ